MKRPGLKALIVAAALLLPAAAVHAQTDNPTSGTRSSGRIQEPSSSSSSSPAKPAKPDAQPTKEQMTKGKADVPALLQAAGARCTMGDAAARGSGTSGGKKVEIYETTCTNGPGYLLVKTEGVDKPAAYPCLAVADQGTKCVLPDNADPKPALAKLAQAAGRTCNVSNARYIGSSTTTGEHFYELACSGAGGFRLGIPASASAPPETTDCLALADSTQPCTLTTKAQALAGLTPLVQASGKACQVSDGRFVGASDKTKQSYYEVACGAQPGFVIVADTTTGRYKSSLTCGEASASGVGCKYTSATASAAEDDARYSRLAAAAGFPCQVNRSRVVGSDSSGRTAVELACANRPDGGFGLFPTSGSGAPEIVNCIKASAELKMSCTLTQPTALYARYSAALVAKGHGACKVSNARYIGTSGGGDVIETACTDGKPGWVITFTPGGGDSQVRQLLTCGQSANDGRPCELPGNVSAVAASKRG